MHLLIGLDEDDDRTLAASDAADGGDIDDVVEVLTTGGMRKAHHFVGVHWQPRTRIVAFGPVCALVTLADGSEHDVRAPSARVWTDLELPEHPERVVLRVLDESERSQPVPPQLLIAGVPAGPAVGASAADGAPVVSGDGERDGHADAGETMGQADSTHDASSPVPVAEAAPAPTPAIPTFGAGARGGSAVPGTGSGSSPWGRSWARRDETPSPPAVSTAVEGESSSAPAVPTGTAPETVGPQVSSSPVPASPALRSWGSVSPAIPVRAAGQPTPRTDPAPAAPETTSAAPVVPSTPEPARPEATPLPAPPVATDLPSAPQRDVDSTWAARPVPEGDPAADQVAAPSYDYLFGHTTAADEHRKVLAQLTQPADDDDGTPEDDEVLSIPAVADTSDAAVTNAPPAPVVPERPIPSAPEVPEGGLISSVPWATPSSAPAPEPEAEVPTFSGRHTPPAAPSLLPPVNTPPPGARAAEAAPLISTGPPPAVAHEQPVAHQRGVHDVDVNQSHVSQRDGWAVPHATPVLRTPPTVPIATTPTAPVPGAAPTAPAQPSVGAEPSFDVPLGGPFAGVNRSATISPETGGSAGDTVQPAWTGASEADDDDETELTVDRSALLEARNAAQNQTFSGPSVLAVLCSAGHPTPPHSDHCRVCGSGIPPQEPFTMPRPPLGVLRLSTGDVVTLDRSVLLGRAPKLGDGLAAHDRPHVVKVPSPERDVSRNHVEVILEGWHVLIRDLGTTNGTTVTLPGETPVRLRANDQQVLEPGSLVSMADEVSFTFEAAP
ncbi:MAG: FHA domain-containing protein [Terrabacter sp.]